MTDQDLLQAFVQRDDEDAFRQIVDRYLGVVYGAARRQVRDAHMAEDVAQAVFIMLASKSRSFRDGTILAGWLVTAARLAAKSAQRGEMRRKQREQRVAEMNLQAHQDADAIDPLLLGPEIDEVLSHLSPADRTAVTLRYLQDKSIREVAEVLGTTEAAANKRVLRAMARLREICQRRGMELAPTALAAELTRQASIEVPAQLTPLAVTTAALAAARPPGGATTAAATIASAALAAMSWRSTFSLLRFAAMLLIALLVAAVAIQRFTNRAPANPRGAVAPLTAIPNDPARPIKVGFYLSLRTEMMHIERTGAPRWNTQTSILNEMRGAPDLDIVPVLEPGSEADPQMAARLTQFSPNKAPVNIMDPAALRQLDVIVTSSSCFAPDEAMAAIEQAVRGGTGLLVRQCLGGDQLGYGKPVVRSLRLLADADPEALVATVPAQAKVLTDHPLLGTMAAGTVFPLRTYGAYGTLIDGATPLLEVTDTRAVVVETTRTPISVNPDFHLYPLVVGQLGNGRVVSCSFGSSPPPPPAVSAATAGQFTPRAIRWAANRPVD